MFILRNSHPLFFSYNPLGFIHDTNGLVPDSFCPMCRCPKEYCCDTVFGSVTKTHVLQLNRREGLDNVENKDIIHDFKRVYSNLVTSKLIWNNHSLKSIDYAKHCKIPSCVRRNSLVRMLEKVKKERESEVNAVLDHVNLDATEEELMATFRDMNRSFQSARGEIEVDDDDEQEDSKMPASSRHTTDRSRTAVEQQADIGPMFRVMRDYTRKMNEVDCEEEV